MRRPLLLALIAGSGFSCACLTGCGHAPAAFEWQQREIRLGQVFRNDETTAKVAWSITGTAPVELLGLRSSCGCIVPELSLEGGKPWTPGVYPSGTRGEALLRVRPDRAKGQLAESMPMLWRFPGDPELQVAEVRVCGAIVDAWHVEPATVQRADLAAAEQPEFELRWRALVATNGVPRAECTTPAVRLGPPEVIVSDDGVKTIIVRGRIARPAHDFEVRGNVVLRDVQPAAPDVPVLVTFARSVRVVPERVLTLAAGPDGRFAGTVRVHAAPAALRGTELHARIEIEPAAMAQTLAIVARRISHQEIELSVSCPREAADKRRYGNLLIHHGIDTDSPVKLLWYVQG